jgi:excisionase family DNA binding protein
MAKKQVAPKTKKVSAKQIQRADACLQRLTVEMTPPLAAAVIFVSPLPILGVPARWNHAMTITSTTTWLGAAEVAEMLDLSRSKVPAMAMAGTLPAYRIGKS